MDHNTIPHNHQDSNLSLLSEHSHEGAILNDGYYSNGEKTVVLDGLIENKRTITEGAFLIRLSQLINADSAHNH